MSSTSAFNSRLQTWEKKGKEREENISDKEATKADGKVNMYQIESRHFVK